MPEWSNGVDLGSTGVVPAEVRILFPALGNQTSNIKLSTGD